MSRNRPPRVLSRPLRRALLALLLVVTAGCALPELAWERADDVIIARANDWLELEPLQEQRLRERLTPWLRDSRRDRLPEIAGFLREVAGRVSAEVDMADVSWAHERFDTLYESTLSSFLPVIVPTLGNLSQSQVQHLARRIEQRNARYRERYIEGRDAGKYAIAERVIQAVERWTGPLTPRQQDLIHDRVRALPRTAPGWLRYRQRMQQRLLMQIEQGAAEPEVEQTLLYLWVERGRGPNGADIPIQQLRAGFRRMLVELNRRLSPGQRAELRRQLLDRAAVIQSLADSAPASARRQDIE